jgi:hypothetical protein
MEFHLTEDHIKLLRSMYVDDYVDVAPVVGQKRPYGNSDVLSDLANILMPNTDKCDNCGTLSSDDDEAYLMKIHKETGTALQIVLVTGKFEKGKYKKSCQYDARSWEKV